LSKKSLDGELRHLVKGIVSPRPQQLAAALGIDVHEILQANHERRLNLEMIEAYAPGGEGATAKRYTFSVGDKIGSLTIATPIFCGTA
jgi:hypothetical protein